MPRRAAAAIASVRLSTFILEKMLFKCALTVVSLMKRLRPICLLLCPLASVRSTVISRSVRSAPLMRSASLAASETGTNVSPAWTLRMQFRMSSRRRWRSPRNSSWCARSVLLGEDVAQRRPGVAAEALGLDAGENHRHAKQLRRLGEHQGIVEHRLAVDIGHAEDHLWLVVDQQHRAVLRREQTLVQCAFHCVLHQ